MSIEAIDLSAPPRSEANQLPMTWMLRNLHRKHTVDSLHMHFQSAGVDSRLYNMLYIPFDNRKKANARYAFINFVDDKAVKQVIGKLQAELGPDADGKFSVLPANIQGVEASISEYIQRQHGRPSAKQQLLLLYEGQRISAKTALLLYSSRQAAASIMGPADIDHDLLAPPLMMQETPIMMSGLDSAIGSPANSKHDQDPECSSSASSLTDPRQTDMEWSQLHASMNYAPPTTRTILQERKTGRYNDRINHYDAPSSWLNGHGEDPRVRGTEDAYHLTPSMIDAQVNQYCRMGPSPAEVPLPGVLFKNQAGPSRANVFYF